MSSDAYVLLTQERKHPIVLIWEKLCKKWPSTSQSEMRFSVWTSPAKLGISFIIKYPIQSVMLILISHFSESEMSGQI